MSAPKNLAAGLDFDFGDFKQETAFPAFLPQAPVPLPRPPTEAAAPARPPSSDSAAPQPSSRPSSSPRPPSSSRQSARDSKSSSNNDASSHSQQSLVSPLIAGGMQGIAESAQQQHSKTQPQQQSPLQQQQPQFHKPQPRMPREVPPEQSDRARPSSFFGMEQPVAAVNAAGQRQALNPESTYAPGSGRPSVAAEQARPSSFFGVEAQPQPQPREEGGQSQAAKIAAYHRGEQQRQAQAAAANPPPPPRSPGGVSPVATSPALSNNGGSMRGGRPASIAPTVTGALLDHSHLRPGQQAALLSHNKTLELYRQNAKKTNDPNLIYELAVFMIDASKSMGSDASSGGSGGPDDGTGAQGKEESAREELVREAVGLLKKIAERGHPDAQYFLADCYANGIGSVKGKQDFDRAYPLFVLAAKHGHPDAAYRAATCCEKGWGCRKDASKALQFYRKSASQGHPGSMYRLATAELNGDLGLKKSAREGVKWLKRSCEAASPEFPHALHELALLHERGIDNIVFVDPEYACELLAQAGEMGYAPSAYKLGVNYEYGRMGCPQDAGLSIHMYNIAAQQNHKEACFALTAWYLVGAPGILPQSDTEAYLWAKKAAEQGLAKAEYAVGYFTEMGIGTVKDLREARAWYRAAGEHGDKRANQRIAALGGRQDASLAGVGSGVVAPAPIPVGVSTSHAPNGNAQARMSRGPMQPPNAPFPAANDPMGQPSYPSPATMRDAQNAMRAQSAQQQQLSIQQQQAQQAAIAQQYAQRGIAPPQPPQHGPRSPPGTMRGQPRAPGQRPPSQERGPGPRVDPRASMQARGRQSSQPTSPQMGGAPNYPSYPAAPADTLVQVSAPPRQNITSAAPEKKKGWFSKT